MAAITAVHHCPVLFLLQASDFFSASSSHREAVKYNENDQTLQNRDPGYSTFATVCILMSKMEQTGPGDMKITKHLLPRVPTTSPQYAVTLVYSCSAMTLLVCVSLNSSFPSVPYCPHFIVHFLLLPIQVFSRHRSNSVLWQSSYIKFSTSMCLYLETGPNRKVKVNSGHKGRGLIR